MRQFVLLQLLSAVSASHLDLSLQSLERSPEDLCQRGATVANLGANKLTAVPPCCLSFRGLHVHRNLIQELPENWLQPCQYLEELSVSANRLRSLPARLLRSAPRLRRLQASRNQLGSLPPELLHNATSLQELDLSHNQLKELPPALLETTTQLTELFLQGNSLLTIPEHLLEKCSGLQQLRLSGNRLVRLPGSLLAAAPRLRKLLLDRNQIAALDAGAFHSNRALEAVDLSSNQLTSLPSGLFASANSLQYLILRNNSVTVVPSADTLPEQRLQLDLRDNHLPTVEDFAAFGSSRVWLDGNKWRCGCSLAPVIEEASSARQLRWFQRRPLCYQEQHNRRSFSDETVSQCHKLSSYSGAMAATVAAVRRPDKNVSVATPKAETSSDSVWRSENSTFVTLWTNTSVTNTPNVTSLKPSPPEFGSAVNGTPNTADDEIPFTEVDSSDTGSTVTDSSGTVASRTDTIDNADITTYNSETTRSDMGNLESYGTGTSETDNIEISSIETDVSATSVVVTYSSEITSPTTGSSENYDISTFNIETTIPEISSDNAYNTPETTSTETEASDTSDIETTTLRIASSESEDSESVSPLGSSVQPYTIQALDYEFDGRSDESGFVNRSTRAGNTNKSATFHFTDDNLVTTVSESGSSETDVNDASGSITTTTTGHYDDSDIYDDIITY